MGSVRGSSIFHGALCGALCVAPWHPSRPAFGVQVLVRLAVGGAVRGGLLHRSLDTARLDLEHDESAFRESFKTKDSLK